MSDFVDFKKDFFENFPDDDLLRSVFQMLFDVLEVVVSEEYKNEKLSRS